MDKPRDNGSMNNEYASPEEMKRYYKYLGHLSRKATEEKARRGEPTCGAPTGYVNVTTLEGKRIEIDPVLGPLVKEAFERATKVRTSLRAILAELTPKGLVSRNGTPLGPSALLTLLSNPFYVGKLRYGGQLFQGQHPALVSEKLFEQVQERLHRRRRNPQLTTN